MKRTLVLVAALLLMGSLAWAETPAGEAAPGAEGFAGGGCVLPDLARLTPDQIPAAALAAGFEMSTAVPATIQMCPTTFHCDSLFNCDIFLCSASNIGRCCSAGGGAAFCCPTGNIIVTQCSCHCTGNPCAIQCPQSTDIRWHCS